ncbi:MAG: GMC family oxidoreductase N-terminal domain-containing protein [Myxococcota bacterium]
MPDERDIRILTALGEAVLPAGEVLRGFDEGSARRVLDYMVAEGAAELAGFRAFLRGLDAAARLRHGRGLAGIPPEARLRLLDRLESMSWAGRVTVKMATAPIKAVHLDDPRVFEALGLRYLPEAASPEPDRAREQQAFDGDRLEGVRSLEADVVVVGTGAGGAVVAAELARRGREVIMLEAGPYLDRGDFTRLSRLEATRRALRPLSETVAVGNTLIPIPVGRTVGGTTTVNSGTCYRTPRSVLEHWSRDLGLEGLSPERMAPYFERVEEVLEVGPNEMRYLGGPARVVARGCEALGYSHGPLQRNAPGCDAQALCCFGCPTDAKRSTNVSYVPRALRAGALLVTGARVDRILVRQGTAYGVVASVGRSGGDPAPLTVRASRVVLACGTLHTPTLLMGEGLGGDSGHLGRHLSIHPAAGCYATFDESIAGMESVPQGYGIEEFHDEGILFEGAFTPVELMSADLKLRGPALTRLLEEFDHLTAFGFMVKDRSNGRVIRGRGGSPRVLYRLGGEEVRRLHRGMGILIDVYRAAGARTIHPPVHGHEIIRDEDDVRRFHEARFGPRDFELSAYHPLGTARMSARSRDGVVSPAHEVWGTARLHVVDGSVMPSSLGVNPQISIMAMATRAAERIDDLLGRDLDLAA